MARFSEGQKSSAKVILDELLKAGAQGYLLGTKNGDDVLANKIPDSEACDSKEMVDWMAIMSATAYGACGELYKSKEDVEFVYVQGNGNGARYLISTQKCVLMICTPTKSTDLEKKLVEIRKELIKESF